jgi:hypothetical protein
MRHLLIAAAILLASCASTSSTLSKEDQQVVASIHTKVSANWYAIPYADTTKKLNTRINLLLNGDGTIASLQVTGPSGNVNFDNGLKVAIYKAQPFTMPQPKRQSPTMFDLTFTK